MSWYTSAQTLFRNVEHLSHLVDHLLTMQASTEFDQVRLAYLPGDEEGK